MSVEATADGYFSEAASSPKSGGAGLVTWGFNAALFGFHLLLGVLQFLFVSGRARGVPVAGLVMTTLFDAAWHAVVVLATARFVRESWSRLMPSIAAVRAITYEEAVALLLTAGLIFSR